MGDIPSKNNNASPTTQAVNSLNSTTTGTSSAAPASEPEPDDRRSSSLYNSQSNYSARSTPKSSHNAVNGTPKYKDKKIQSKTLVANLPKHFTYYNEFQDDDYAIDLNAKPSKVLSSSPVENKFKPRSWSDTLMNGISGFLSSQNSHSPIGTASASQPITAVAATSVNGNIDTEISSSFSDMFTVNSSSNSSLSITPPGKNILPPIIEKDSRKKFTRPKKDSIDIDSIIDRLLSLTSSSPILHGKSNPLNSYLSSSSEFIVSPKEISTICQKVRNIFLDEPSLLKLQAPVKVVGDIHGQYNDLLRILKLSGFPPNSSYLFLGDYVDRGKQSLETILLLFCYKIKYPDHIFMLRGNHESSNISKVYGFYDECKRRLNVKCWRLFVDVFNTLPIAGVINEKIFCVHGGLSPHLYNMKQIADIHRPTDIPESGLLADLLWSDPDASLTDWSESDRGVSYCFGKKIVDNFNREFKFDLIIRGHMVVEDGYEFFAKKKLVTVFSAPNYCGEFNNWGAVMSVNHKLLCSFELLKPNKKLMNSYSD